MPHAPIVPDWEGRSHEDSHEDVPEYLPDIPTHDNINSREAAAKAKALMPQRRRMVCREIETHPGDYSCDDFCNGFLRELQHGGVSGMLTGLWQHGLIWRVGRKRNERGNYEATLALSPDLIGRLDEVDWDTPLRTIQETWSLTGYHVVNTVPTVTPPPLPTIVFTCTGCGNTSMERDLFSKYGKPQVVGFIREKRLMEAKCAKCNAKPRKGLQAIWREQ